MNCRDVKKHLVKYIDGSLDKNLKMSLREHLKTCKGCAAELAELKNYFNEVGSISRIPAPDDFLEKVHERLESRNRSKKILRALFTPVQIKIPIGAAGAVAVAAAVVFFLRGFPFQTTEQIAMAPRKSEPAEVGQKPKEKHLDLDTGEKAGGITVTETREKSGEPELKKEAPDMVIEPDTGLPEAEPEEYIDESTESVMEEIADISELEETTDAGLAMGKQKNDVGPVEVALLIKSSAAGEPDVSVTARKKAPDSGFSEKSIQEDELTAGAGSIALDKSAEGPQPLPSMDAILSDLEDLALKMGGDIISVEYDTHTNLPLFMTVEIPAENYTFFLAGLYRLGELSGEPPSTLTQENEFVSLEIELITDF